MSSSEAHARREIDTRCQLSRVDLTGIEPRFRRGWHPLLSRMHINDENTLSDIEGVILCLQADLEVEEPEFPIRPRFEELLARIDLKLRKNRNAIRRNWFTTAREHAATALTAFDRGECESSDRALSKCWEYLEEGNKAHRRKTAFVVRPDGTVHFAPAPDVNGPKDAEH